MARYKQDQGRMVRLAVFWSLALLLFYGCSSLSETLAGQFNGLAQPALASLPKLPVLDTSLSGAFLISAVVFLGATFLAYRWLESPRIADLLIETEHELRKVTWPTGKEVMNSSIVVVVCVALLMAFLAGADWALARVLNPLLF
ncbi:MAG: preprotein translocase subunit SecE [Planctomycetes bacterium]|nr:preprotein translocase subunit SecE [Planctomycetota bacterium]